MSSTNKVAIEDLEYELRMLLGSARLWRLFREREIGNPNNYFMDSAFVHARNLYNFFTRKNKKYDGNIKAYGEELFSSKQYNDWEEALNVYVLHIKSSRRESSNKVGDLFLSDQVSNFADEIVTLWKDWIKKTNNSLEQIVASSLANAERDAENDYIQVESLLMGRTSN